MLSEVWVRFVLLDVKMAALVLVLMSASAWMVGQVPIVQNQYAKTLALCVKYVWRPINALAFQDSMELTVKNQNAFNPAKMEEFVLPQIHATVLRGGLTLIAQHLYVSKHAETVAIAQARISVLAQANGQDLTVERHFASRHAQMEDGVLPRIPVYAHLTIVVSIATCLSVTKDILCPITICRKVWLSPAWKLTGYNINHAILLIGATRPMDLNAYKTIEFFPRQRRHSGLKGGEFCVNCSSFKKMNILFQTT